MSNNTNDCLPVSDWIAAETKNAKYFTYEILVYPYFIFGILGHALFLWACRKRRKSEPAFLYQAYLSAVRILEIVSFTLLTFAFNRWAGLIMEGEPWFQKSFVCMWFAAHLCIPLVNGFINTSLFLTLCIAIDRLIAIAKPHTYRQKCQRKKHKICALVSCIFVGFGIVAYDTGRFFLTYNEETGYYSIHDNFEYLATKTSTFFIAFRMCVFISGVVGLWVCNVAVIRMHRVKMMQIGTTTVAVTNAIKTASEILRETKRKEAERTLLSLMLCQGLVNGVANSSLAAWYLSFYLAPNWLRCSGILMLWAPMDDAALQIAALLDFYFPLALSKSVRQMVFVCSNPPAKAASAIMRAAMSLAEKVVK